MGVKIRPVEQNGVMFYPLSILEAIFDATTNQNLRTILGGKAEKSTAVTGVTYDIENGKLVETINGTDTDIITIAALKTALNLVKADVGLGNVTNDAQVKRTEMGAASGVATLDAQGKVPSSQLPSYVDDVVEGYYYNSKFWEESTHETEIPGESGKIYLDITNPTSVGTYRWSVSVFVKIVDVPSVMTQQEASAGTDTNGMLISPKVLADTIKEKAVAAGTAGSTEYADVSSLIS